MGLKLKKLRDQVIVVTGASSGIGLTTAELAAQRGARVVLNARNESDLRQATDGIVARGGRAIAVAGDVADDEALELVAQRAIDAFGGFDTWVNNAGVGMYGKAWEMTLADKRRLFDINFWGVVHGCRAALPYLREHGGALINIGSVAGDVATPLLGIYSASKFAVKGYTDALRMELEHEGAPVSVTLVKPGPTNTPFIEHARNYMEAEPEFAPPVFAPEEVAHAILRCAERPAREIVVGGPNRLMTMVGTVAPRVMDLYMENAMFRQQQRHGEPADWDDSLDAPSRDGSRRGPTERRTIERSAYTRAALSDAGRILPIVALGAIVATTVRTMRKAG